jgi:nitrogen fixation protein NifB
VLVAVATKGGGLVNQHFRPCQGIHDLRSGRHRVKFIGHRKIADYCQGGYGEEAMPSPKTSSSTVKDCQAVLASKVGPCPSKQLAAAGLQVIEAYDVIETVARQFYDEQVLKA